MKTERNTSLKLVIQEVSFLEKVSESFKVDCVKISGVVVGAAWAGQRDEN